MGVLSGYMYYTPMYISVVAFVFAYVSTLYGYSTTKRAENGLFPNCTLSLQFMSTSDKHFSKPLPLSRTKRDDHFVESYNKSKGILNSGPVELLMQNGCAYMYVPNYATQFACVMPSSYMYMYTYTYMYKVLNIISLSVL